MGVSKGVRFHNTHPIAYANELEMNRLISQLEGYVEGARCCIPCDHIPIRSWPLFLARELMRDLIETLKAEQST